MTQRSAVFLEQLHRCDRNSSELHIFPNMLKAKGLVRRSPFIIRELACERAAQASGKGVTHLQGSAGTRYPCGRCC